MIEELEKLRVELAQQRGEIESLIQSKEEAERGLVGLFSLCQSLHKRNVALAEGIAVCLASVRALMEHPGVPLTQEMIAEWTELALQHGPSVVGVSIEHQEMSAEDRYALEGLAVWDSKKRKGIS